MHDPALIELHKRLAPLHLLAYALIAGVLLFAITAWLLAPLGGSATPGVPVGAWNLSMPALMRMIWCALALVQVPLGIVLAQQFLNRAASIRRSDATLISPFRRGVHEGVHETTFNMFRTATITRMALLESVALIGVIAVLFSRDPLDLLLAAVPVVVMIAMFPTIGRWLAFDRATRERAVPEPPERR